MGNKGYEEKLLSELLPYTAMIDENTVVTKDAVLLSFIEVTPVSTQEAVSAQRMRDLNQLERMLGDGWMLWIDTTRRPLGEGAGGEYGTRFVISVGYAQKERSGFRPWKFGKADEIAAGEESIRGDVWMFSRVREDIVQMFAAVFEEVELLSGDAVLTYLFGIWDDPDQPVVVPRGADPHGRNEHEGADGVGPFYLDAYLGQRIAAQNNVCELRDADGTLEHVHVATVHDYAAEDRPGMIAELMSSSLAVRVVTRIIFAGRNEAASSVWRERQKRFKNRKGLGRLYSERVMDDAQGGVKAYVDTRLVVRSWRYAAGRGDIEAARKIVNAWGFPVKHETGGAREAFCGTFPGEYVAGQEFLVTRVGELARLLPLWFREQPQAKVAQRGAEGAAEFDVLA